MIKVLKYSEVKRMALEIEASMMALGETLEQALRVVLAEQDGIQVIPDCRFIECKAGMGLAGGGGCSGDPYDPECWAFTYLRAQRRER